jgi:ABC-type multidrug transport system fused ATPase/permease subunit
MTTNERTTWFWLTGARAFLSVFDLVGILAIGFVVTSTAIFLTEGSNQNRLLEFAGFQIPAVNAQTLPIISIAILATFIIKALLSIFITRKVAYFVAKIEARAARAIAEKVFGGDLSQARIRSREEMAYAIQVGSPAAFNQILNFTSTVIAEGSLFLLICIGFLLVDPWSTLAAVTYFALIALVIQYFVGTLMARAGTESAKGTIDANAAVSDLIAVFRELSVLRIRHKFIARIYQSRISAANSSATQMYLNGMPRYIVEAALIVGVAAFILVQALNDDIVSSAATVGVFLSGGFRLTAAMLPLQASLLNIKGSVPAANSVYEILGDKESDSREQDKLLLPSIDFERERLAGPQKVTLQNTSFQYSGSQRFAVEQISLQIVAGQQVAIIGPSGAGKSTLADLICGLLAPSNGTVEIEPARGNPDFINFGSVSYVPQKPGLVAGSVAQNVALGLEHNEIDENQVWIALEKAHLTDVIQALPNKIHTDLGKYQDGLSGGQVQRLGLARALYSNPGLLVMDEATSALDAESESEIAQALDQMRGKVTVILIAHRLNTVQHADKVFLIEAGKLSDQGTFQELVQRNSSVEKLVKLMKVDEN